MMNDAIAEFFSAQYMPHGHCYFWKPEILWLNVLSDLAIASAYFSIPLALFYFLRKRKDLEFKWLFILFSLFIAFCGLTHLLSIFVVWHGAYGVHGLSKLATAIVSVITAFYVFKCIPLALSLPSPSTLRAAVETASNEKLHRIRAEIELHRERVFRESTVGTNTGIVICDSKGIIRIANDLLFQTLGYNQVDVEGKSIDMLISMPANHQQKTFVEQFILGDTGQTKMASGLFMDGLHKNGNMIPLEVTLKKGEESQQPIIYVSITDITEKVETNKQLTDSNLIFERITSAADEALWEYNIDTQSMWLSARTFELLGYEAGEQEHTIENWLDFVDNEKREAVKGYIFNPLSDYGNKHLEFQIQHKDGLYRWVSTHAGNTLDTAGNCVYRSGTIADIHERKMLEQQLTEQEKKYRSIVNQLPMGIHIYAINSDNDMVFIDSNPAADTILGIKNQEYYGLPYEDAFPTTKGTDLPMLLKSAALAGTTSERETIQYADDNIAGVFSVIFFQLTPGHAVILFQDVSERRKAELALKESEQFISRALNTSFTGIYIFDFEKNSHDFINKAYTLILGYTLDELRTMSDDDFIACFHEDDKDGISRHIDHISHCKDKDKVFEIEYRFKHRLGHWVWCLSKDSVFELDENGKAKSFIGSFLDISERKAGEEDLRQALRKLQLVMEGSHDGFWHWLDPENDVAEWSDSLFTMLGYASQEFAPSFSRLHELVHPEDHEYAVAALENSIASNQRFDVEYRIADKSGNYRWYRGRGTPYFSAEDKLVEMAGSFSDIHLTKELQQDLIRSNEELEQFSFIASHDLKEPLRTIRTFVEYLLQDVKSGDHKRLEEDAGYIKSACDRMATLIEALLLLSRAGAYDLQFEQCSVNDVVSEVQNRLQTQINESQAKIIVAEDLPIVNSDKIQLELVFQNLIQNAIKFCKKESHPIIEITSGEQPDPAYVDILVRDQGIGIPRDKLSEIFGVFKKLHAADVYPGTGIGLAIVDKIIKRLKGSLRVESAEGKETVFVISLPKHQESQYD